MNKATVYAKTKNVRISPKKVAPVMNLVRNKSLTEAKILLSFDRSKAAKLVLKTLKSAEANAKHNLSLNPANLYVADLQVSGGTTIKRMRIVARGRTSPILKRTSHFIVGLSEVEAEPKKGKI
ncbi:MAG TPA: 50S ribosomal protein L22 [Candidatus Saccharimonadales bacterium]|nr:50S ribosomal protein L22 [Candidatus Saccharimonadales bacterium]